MPQIWPVALAHQQPSIQNAKPGQMLGWLTCPVDQHSSLVDSFLLGSLGWPRLATLSMCAVLHVLDTVLASVAVKISHLLMHKNQVMNQAEMLLL